MPLRDTSDYAFYHTLLKGSYRKGIKAFRAIMQDPVLSKQFASSIGGISVIFGITDDGNSKELRQIFEESPYYEESFLTYLSRCCGHTFESLDEVLTNHEEFQSMCEDGTIYTLLESESFEEKVLSNEESIRTILSTQNTMEYIASDIDRLSRYITSDYGDIIFTIPMAQEVITNSIPEDELCRVIQRYAIKTGARSITLIELIQREYSGEFFKNKLGFSLFLLHKKAMTYLKNGWSSLSAYYPYLLNDGTYTKELLLNDPEKMLYLTSDDYTVNADRMTYLFNTDQKLVALLEHTDVFDAIVANSSCSENMVSITETNVAKAISQVLEIESATYTSLCTDATNWSKVMKNKRCLQLYMRVQKCNNTLYSQPDRLYELASDEEAWKDAFSISTFRQSLNSMTDVDVANVLSKLVGVSYTSMSTLLASEDFSKVLENEIAKQIFFSCNSAISAALGNPDYLKKVIGSIEEFKEAISYDKFRDALWSLEDATITTNIKNLSGSTGSYSNASQFTQNADFLNKVAEAEDKVPIYLAVYNSIFCSSLRSNSSSYDNSYNSVLAILKQDDLRDVFMRHDERGASPCDFYSFDGTSALKFVKEFAGLTDSASTSLNQIMDNPEEWDKLRKSDIAVSVLAELNNLSYSEIWSNATYIKKAISDKAFLKKLMRGKVFSQVMNNTSYFTVFNTEINNNPGLVNLFVDDEDIFHQIIDINSKYSEVMAQNSHYSKAVFNNEKAFRYVMLKSDYSSKIFSTGANALRSIMISSLKYTNWLFSYEDFRCAEIISTYRGDNSNYTNYMNSNDITTDIWVKYLNDYNWVSVWGSSSSYYSQGMNTNSFKQVAITQPIFLAYLIKNCPGSGLGNFITETILGCSGNGNYNPEKVAELEKLLEDNHNLFIKSEGMLIGAQATQVSSDSNGIFKLSLTTGSHPFNVYTGSQSSPGTASIALLTAPTITEDTPPVYGFNNIYSIPIVAAEDVVVSTVVKFKRYSLAKI